MEFVAKPRGDFGDIFVGVLSKDAQDICGINKENLAETVLECEPAVIRGNQGSVPTGYESNADNPGAGQVTFLPSGSDRRKACGRNNASGHFG